MEITINENFRITTDGTHNFIIQERKLIKSTKEGVSDRYEWKDVGYYGRLELACTALIDVQEVRSDVKGALDDLQFLRKQLSEEIIRAVQTREAI
ncbi:hypothetical protein [Brevibacillus centrosporus]|uniref:hypothetical protein n=1 Tax=Brevibacillus centrosporus TaxID=54910 RepID=UPI002E20DC3B|nr:hypothetical protein [Brevibacillus centrosporus]